MEEAIGRELSRLGVAGTIALGRTSIELRIGGAPPVSIDLDPLLGRWSVLPEEIRRRKAEEIARRLVDAARASDAFEDPRRAGLSAAMAGRHGRTVAAFFALLLAIGAARLVVPRLSAPATPASAIPSESEATRGARLARACDAVRDRVHRGSTFGPFALEGFAVELWLAGQGPLLREHPAVAGILAGDRLSAAADEKLAEVRDGSLALADGFDGAVRGAGRGPDWNAVTVVFSGGYARAFFQDDLRARFLGLADRLATSSGASYGALYARCAHLRAHDVGAWFYGPDLPGASAAIVYQMGLFAESRVVDRSALAERASADGGEPRGSFVPPGPGEPPGPFELTAITRAAVDAGASLPAWLGAAGGATRGGKPATVIFALAGPARAGAAARDLSRRMGIGPRGAE